MHKPSLGQREVRTTARATLRAMDDKYQISGIAAAYNTRSGDLGGFFEEIAPGAFTKSLRANADVKCLFNHEASQILGRTKSGTLTLSDSQEGLRFVCQLDRTNTAHANVYAAVKRGDIDSCSFAFTVPAGGDSWNDNIRTLRNVNLMDVSAVTYPAYPQGTGVAARKAGAAAAAKWPPSDKIGDSERDARVRAIGRLVEADMRALKESEVSSMNDWMAAKIGAALEKHGLGWRLVAFSSDEDGDYCLACPSETDVEDNAYPPVGRFNYQIDKGGNVVLSAYSRYVYEMGPDGPIMPRSEPNAWQLGGSRFASLVQELRLNTDVRRKMKSSAGIFTRR